MAMLSIDLLAVGLKKVYYMVDTVAFDSRNQSEVLRKQ